jgi:hypothetical protein
MEYYIIYEIGDSCENNGRFIWPGIYTSYEVTVGLIQAKIYEAGRDDDGNPQGHMEIKFSKEEADSADGTMVGNLYDYDVQYYVKKMRMGY